MVGPSNLFKKYKKIMETILFLGIVGAAIATILPGIGSALGVRMVGETGMGLISENPDRFGKVLLLQALPGTQGIYGFLTGVMILQKIGILGGAVPSSLNAGIYALISALPIGIVGLFSAFWQAKVALQGVEVVAKKPEESGKPVIMAALIETYAVLALLVSILIISGIK